MRTAVAKLLILVFAWLFLAAPMGVQAQVTGLVNDVILNNEGTPPGTAGPGNQPSGVPGGSIDITDSILNALTGAFFRPGPGMKGELETDGMAQWFSGNPAFLRKFGSVKSGVGLPNLEFTWDLGASLHLFGNIRNLDQVNKDFDFRFRQDEHFRMDIGFSRLINRAVWEAGEHGDYIVDARNWWRGDLVSTGGGAGNLIIDPKMSANGADPTRGFYMIYHSGLVTGTPVTVAGVSVPDYWTTGFGNPQTLATKDARDILERYTPRLNNDFHFETQFRPAPWIRAIAGYHTTWEGGQVPQHVLTFVNKNAPGVLASQMLPIPDPPGPDGAALVTSPDDDDHAFGFHHPKFQWVGRQITVVRDPLAHYATALKAGASINVRPFEVLWTHGRLDFTNQRILNPFLVDLLNRPFGWNQATTLATGTPTGRLWNDPAAQNEPFDAGFLIPDYRVENNHWNQDHFRMQVPVGPTTLQFQFAHNKKVSDGSFFNVRETANHASADLSRIPAGMFQSAASGNHRNIMQLPTFDSPKVNLNAFSFYAPLKVGDWHVIPNFDNIGFASNPGVKGEPNYNAMTAGVTLQRFGPRHNLSLDFSYEGRKNSAIYDTRSVNSWTIQNPVVNPDSQAQWLQFLPQIAFLWGAGGACATGQGAPGTCPGPQGSLGSVSTIIANFPTHPVGLRTITSSRWNGSARYTQRLTDTLALNLNGTLTHNNNPYFRTDPSDENQGKAQLRWRPSPVFSATLDFTRRNSRNTRFLFPERRTLDRASISVNWQATKNFDLTAQAGRSIVGTQVQSPTLGTSLTNGIDLPIALWLLQGGLTATQIRTTSGTGTITPAWAAMYILPDQNAINYTYRNQNSTYNLGFNYAFSQAFGLFGNFTHASMTASYSQGIQKIENPLEVAFGFQETNRLWGLNTPPNLNVRQNNLLLGFRWRHSKDATLSFFGGLDEYQDIGLRLSRVGQFGQGITPPDGTGTSTGQLFRTSLASFGSAIYPLSVSPDTGKVVYFTVRWTKSF